MDKRVVQPKFSFKQPAVIFLFVGCALPVGATVLDILRHGLSFSLPSILAVQTTQPLHWVIDSVPFLTFFLIQALARTNTTATSSRTSTNNDGQGANSAKATQLVNELKNDLAKQRRIEETLRASEEFYRNLIENTNDGIATISVDGTVTSVNRGFERMLGRLREDMIGKHYSTLLSVASLGIVEDRIRRFHSGEKIPSLLEIELLRQNNIPVTVEARVRPISDTKGTVIGFQGVYRDLAKRAAMKKGGVPAGATLTQSASTVMPWEQPASQPISEAPPSRPDGYSLLAQCTKATADPSFTASGEHHDVLADEKFTGSLSTANSTIASSPSAAELQSVSSPTTTFRFAETTSDTTMSHVPAPLQMESTEAVSVPPQFTLVTDRSKKDDRQTKVVPFPTTSMTGTGYVSPEPSLNLDEALTRVDGDRTLLCEMAGVFLDEYPTLLETMQDALSHGNAQTLTYAVHTLKGSVGNFAATNAFEAALRLEKIARQGNLPQAKAALAELEAELARLVPLLTSLKMEIAA